MNAIKHLHRHHWLGYLIGVGLLMLGSASLNARALPEIAYLAYTEGYWQVWVTKIDGKEQRQITQSAYDKYRLSWFPDGQALLVNGTLGELVKVDIESGTEVPITLPLTGMSDAVLSPDGQQLTFSLSTANSMNDNNIWLVNLDGTGLQKLTNMKWLQHEPVWSPDGQWIYFLSGKGDQTHDIWRVSVVTQKTEQLTAGQLYNFDLAFSPNGTLAFSSNRKGNYELWVKKEAGDAEALTDDPALDGRPTWSPDEDSIVFESSRGGQLNLWQLELEPRTLVQLTHHDTGARAPVWYHGGISTP